MKQILLSFIFLITLSFSVNAQHDYREGYILQNTDTIKGLVDYRGDVRNALKVNFKTSETAENTTYLPTEIKGYGFTTDNRHYKSAFVQDSANITGKDYFLRVLVRGKASLFYLKDEMQNDRYFISKEESELLELKRIAFYVINDQTKQKIKKYNNEYLKTLSTVIIDCPTLYNVLEKTKFKQSDLKTVTIQYNLCSNPDAPVFAEEKIKSKFTGGVVAGFEQSSLSINSEAKLRYIGIDYTKTNTVTGGLSANITLPWLNEKLSAQTELLYTQNKFSGRKEDKSGSAGRQYFYDVNFETNRLKLPILLRYTFPRGKIKPFFNIGIINSYTFKYVQTLTASSVYAGETTLDAPEPVFQNFRKYSQGLVVGAGVQKNVFKNKSATLELRYEQSNGFTDIITINTKVSSLSFLLGMYL